jgi:hypothetical protein
VLERDRNLSRRGRQRTKDRGQLGEAVALKRDPELVEGMIELGPQFLRADPVSGVELCGEPESARAGLRLPFDVAEVGEQQRFTGLKQWGNRTQRRPKPTAPPGPTQ